MTGQQQTTAPTLPDGIEVFYAGRHQDDAGNWHEFTEADLAEMVATYNPALREAPLTVGHPKTNAPAYGWVKSVFINAAGRLAINSRQVEPAFAQMLADGRFKKRSLSLYGPQTPGNPVPGKWYVRHVGFLGAAAPAVPGLKDMDFSAGADALAFIPLDFSLHQPEPNMDTEKIAALEAQVAQQKADLEAANARATKAEADVASFAQAQRDAVHSGHVSFAEALIPQGRLLPKDQVKLVATLDILRAAEPVEFSQADGISQKVAGADCADWLKTMLSAGKPVISFGEHAGGKLPPDAPKNDAELAEKAKAHQAKHPGMDFTEACRAVQAQFQVA